MAGQNGAWFAVGRAIRELLLGLTKSKSAGGAARPRAGQDPAGAHTQHAPGQASTGRSQPASGKAAQTTGFSDEDECPGQFGPDATRDLSPAQIRGLRPSYAPDADGDPDPGEVVWTWVPYAEHDGRGKDRPVLVIARLDADTVAGCFLTTKEHRGYLSVGSGGWDGQGRESFLATDRVLRLTDAGMRREGHVLARERFTNVVGQLAQMHGFTV